MRHCKSDHDDWRYDDDNDVIIIIFCRVVRMTVWCNNDHYTLQNGGNVSDMM